MNPSNPNDLQAQVNRLAAELRRTYLKLADAERASSTERVIRLDAEVKHWHARWLASQREATTELARLRERVAELEAERDTALAVLPGRDDPTIGDEELSAAYNAAATYDEREYGAGPDAAWRAVAGLVASRWRAVASRLRAERDAAVAEIELVRPIRERPRPHLPLLAVASGVRVWANGRGAAELAEHGQAVWEVPGGDGVPALALRWAADGDGLSLTLDIGGEAAVTVTHGGYDRDRDDTELVAATMEQQVASLWDRARGRLEELAGGLYRLAAAGSPGPQAGPDGVRQTRRMLAGLAMWPVE